MSSEPNPDIRKKSVVVLGSTGSIGVSAADVIRKNRGRFSAVALSCHTSISELRRQVAEFRPQAVALTGCGDDTRDSAADPAAGLDSGGSRVYRGPHGLMAMIDEIDADIVLNGISGSSGLLPSFRAVEAGRDIALANKETIVMAGPLIRRLAAERGIRIVPVDSEHSAVFQLLRLAGETTPSEIILTASGGAFRDIPVQELERVKPEDALRHPTWKMGPKITIDSATMANKGLEVIEAMHLFGVDADRIKVLIHPQSYVHSLIRTRDGQMYAQISKPDMRSAIAGALGFPEMIEGDFGALDLAGRSLTFLPWDSEKYPMLALAFAAARSGGSAPIVYNAANELAVQAFVEERIPFPSIAQIVEHALDRVGLRAPATLEEILEVDAAARTETNRHILERGI